MGVTQKVASKLGKAQSIPTPDAAGVLVMPGKQEAGAFAAQEEEHARAILDADTAALVPDTGKNAELLQHLVWYAERGRTYKAVLDALARVNKTAKLSRRVRLVYQIARRYVTADRASHSDWTKYLAGVVYRVGSVDALQGEIAKIEAGMVESGLIPPKGRGRPDTAPQSVKALSLGFVRSILRMIAQAETGQRTPGKPKNGPLTRNTKGKKVTIAPYNAGTLVAAALSRVKEDGPDGWAAMYKVREPETVTEAPAPSTPPAETAGERKVA
jgi:hypothetical protein